MIEAGWRVIGTIWEEEAVDANSSGHVSYEERCKSDALTKEGLTPSRIALGRGKSAITRELARNSESRDYRWS